MKILKSLLRPSSLLPAVLFVSVTGLLSLGAGDGCRKSTLEVDCRNDPTCHSDADCGGEQICTTGTNGCLCRARTCAEKFDSNLAVACTGDADCTGTQTCDSTACTCSGGLPPAVFPPITTNTACTTDTDGYVIAGNSNCFIELTEPLVGATATLTVKGSLLNDEIYSSFIDIVAFGETNGYEWTGYHVNVTRRGTDFTAYLFDVTRFAQDKSTWTGPAGPVPLTTTLQVDSGATSATCTLAGADAPTTPLQSSAMGTARRQKVAIAISNATIYQVIVTEP